MHNKLNFPKEGITCFADIDIADPNSITVKLTYTKYRLQPGVRSGARSEAHCVLLQRDASICVLTITSRNKCHPMSV